MNAVTGAPYVGVATGGLDGALTLTPLTIPVDDIKGNAAPESVVSPLTEMTEDMLRKLYDYLYGRLQAGSTVRNRRIRRYAKIDRLVATWQKLDKKESERENIEDQTGKQMALPFNLPVLASHLNDMVSYFSEALAPISNPFFSASGNEDATEMLNKLNRDAIARDYYSELALTLRALLKYNVGGMTVTWESGQDTDRLPGNVGNYWKSIDMYNALWDPAIRNPTKIAKGAEWAAMVSMENRLTLMKNALSGKWVGLESLLSQEGESAHRSQLYKEAAMEATFGEDGQDSKSSTSRTSSQLDWDSYGLGLTSDFGADVDGFEVVDMFCWLVPAQFGLLTEAERKELADAGRNPDAYLELWRFKVIPSHGIVSAEVALDRKMALEKEHNEIPFYLSYLTQDQLGEAQRSFMELMRGFQRFSSAMFNIYIAGMRKNVWGVKGVDPTMFDTSKIKEGDTAAVLESKQPGRDVRSGIMTLDSSTGADGAMQAVGQTLDLKNSFFPSQSLPSQIAGIDRAVSSQVTTVVQGATRSLRMVLRTVDSSLMLPTRLQAYRNLKRYDADGMEKVTDEMVSKMLGSGIESIEAERVTEALWNLLQSIIQNVESMQIFSVPLILSYLSRVMNLSVDLGQFAKQQAAPAGTPPEGGAPPAAAPAA